MYGFSQGAYLLLVMTGGFTLAQGPPTLEKCDELVASKPDERRSYNCYWSAVRAHGRFWALGVLLLAADGWWLLRRLTR